MSNPNESDDRPCEIAAIIQARMGSSRMPGKVLEKIAGKPLLWHIVHRLRSTVSIDTIVLATSVKPRDDILEEFAADEGIECVRGSEKNVLQRFVLANKRYRPEYFLRVCGDSPLIDPKLIDRIFRVLKESGADFGVYADDAHPLNSGFCGFSRRALEKLDRQAGEDPLAQEHVPSYFREHPGFVETVCVPVEATEQLEGVRISVDTPSDLNFISEIYRRLDVPAGKADVREVVGLLKQRPSLLEINEHVTQRAADRPSEHALFVVDLNDDIELRSLEIKKIAKILIENHGWGVTFGSPPSTTDSHLGFGHARFMEFDSGEVEQLLGRWKQATEAEGKIGAMILDSTLVSSERVAEWRGDNGSFPIAQLTDIQELGVRRFVEMITHKSR